METLLKKTNDQQLITLSYERNRYERNYYEHNRYERNRYEHNRYEHNQRLSFKIKQTLDSEWAKTL